MILYMFLFLFSVWALSEIAWLLCPEDRRGPWPGSFEWELWLRQGMDRPDPRERILFLAAAAMCVFVLVRAFRKRAG